MAGSAGAEIGRAERLLKSGQTAEAAMIYRQILDKWPGNRRAQAALGEMIKGQPDHAPQTPLPAVYALAATHQWKELLKLANERLREMPGNGGLLEAKAEAHFHLDEVDCAVDAAAMALRADPKSGSAALMLGRALARCDRHTDALACYHDALVALGPVPELMICIAEAMIRLHRLADAAATLEKSVQYAPNSPRPAIMLASVQADLDDAEAAQETLRALIERMPDCVEAQVRLAVLQRATGQKEQAVKTADAALRLRPADPRAWAIRADIAPWTEQNEQTRRLLKLAETDTADADILFAAFTLCDTLGETEQAMWYLHRANAQRRALFKDPVAENAAQFDRVQAAFGQAMPSRNTDWDGPRMIFVAGLPRSGTTLAEQIIAAHPEASGLGERDWLSHAVNTAAIGEGPVTTEHLTTISQAYKRAMPGVAGAVAVDKTPFNFRMIGHILLSFPEAKVLVMRRDPRAVAWSIYRTNFTERSQSLGFAWRLEDIVAYHDLYCRQMAFWHWHFPGRVSEIDYEAMTADPMAGMQNLVAAAGLSWHDACGRFHETAGLVRSASTDQVRRPIYAGSSDSWRRYKSDLGPVISKWGDGKTPVLHAPGGNA